MPRLTTLSPDDARLDDLLGSAHTRMQRLIREADERARPFYRTTLGREMGCEEAIAEIFAAVERDGDAAVAHYTTCFDGAALAPEELRVPEAAIEAAWNAIEPGLRTALEAAAASIAAYQRRLLPRDFGTALDEPLGVRWTPLDRVGAYVPGGAGGALPLCSTVLMNLIPAAVAGVRELVLVTPPRADGSVAPELLAAARAAGVREVHRVGGVQAIAALACGTGHIARVDKIVGPGNIFVTLAKRAAYGRVDIDMLAGPSEILVLADDSCDPAWVAADLLSQAEHDQLAMAVLLTVEPGIDAAIQDQLEAQLAALPAERGAVAADAIARMGLCIPCTGLAEAIDLVNRYAPEHLEILLADPRPALNGIRHAGAIFVGGYSPEPIGDYVAGPSHTLPTGGTARMWSGIGADTFCKRTSLINYRREDFLGMAPHAIALARAEGLEAHARAIEARLG